MCSYIFDSATLKFAQAVFWERVSETIGFIDKEMSYCLAITAFAPGSGHVTE